MPAAWAHQCEVHWRLQSSRLMSCARRSVAAQLGGWAPHRTTRCVSSYHIGCAIAVAYSSTVRVGRSIAASTSIRVRLSISRLGLAVRIAAVLLVVLRHGGCFATAFRVWVSGDRGVESCRQQTRKLRKDALTGHDADGPIHRRGLAMRVGWRCGCSTRLRR
jgi:hypothetical protein